MKDIKCKKFVIDKTVLRINEDNPMGIKEGVIFTRLVTDKLDIVGSLQISILDEKKELGIHLISINDYIYIPAEQHPYIQMDEYKYPLFVEKTFTDWNSDLVAGEFYIMYNKNDMSKFSKIFINKINENSIEFTEYSSRCNRDKSRYYIEYTERFEYTNYFKNYLFTNIDDFAKRDENE